MSDIVFVTGIIGFGSPDQSFNGGVGFQFTNLSQQPIVVTQLGRWVLAGNTGVHALSIQDITGALLATGSVNCSGATAGQFLYTTLTSPYTIGIGSVVYFFSAEVPGWDFFYNNNNTAIGILPALGFIQSAYNNGTPFNAGNNGGTYTSAGPVSFQFSSPLANWTKTGSVYRTDGSQYSTNSALYDAGSNPNTVLTPSGRFVWGGANTTVSVGNHILLAGAGTGQTTIIVASDGPTFANGTISLAGGATASGFTIIQSGQGTTTAFAGSQTNGWRITNVNYVSAPTAGYFVYAGTYGLIDHCTISGGGGSDEWIFARGPLDSWQTPSSMGTTGAVYIEDCVLNAQGYTDFNSNSRAVVRFCTINGSVNTIKLDAHGYATNSPARSFRHVEFYNNHWVNNQGSAAIEVRGGTAMVFNNLNDAGGGLYLEDYTMNSNLTNLGRYATPFDYPLTDQVGVGQDPKAPASQPAYVWGNIQQSGAWARTAQGLGVASVYTTSTIGYATGTTVISLAANLVQGGGVGAIGIGDAVAFSGDNNRYLVATGIPQSPGLPVNIVLAAPGLLQALPATNVQMTSGPLTLYQYRTGNATGMFVESDVIKANRDFFASSGFDVSTGVSVGTTAQMNALTPTVTGYGFWVTDQGSWNKTVAANTAGLLYTWSGGWNLTYTPFQYPYLGITQYVLKRLGANPRMIGYAPQ